MAMGMQERAAQLTCPRVCQHGQALIVTVDLLIGSCDSRGKFQRVLQHYMYLLLYSNRK